MSNTIKSAFPVILTFALLQFVSGCTSADSTENAPVSGNNRAAVVANKNPAQAVAASSPAAAPAAAPAATPVKQNASAAAPAEKTASTGAANASGITMADFDSLKVGMSYKAVAGILGSAGSTTGGYKTQGGSMSMYSWTGRGESGDWNVTARFDNGKLVNKVQVGLSK